MPSRRRPKPPPVEPPDAIHRFAAMLRESAEHERAETDRVRIEREDAVTAARAAVEHAEALVTARRDLDRAIEGVRVARRTRSGVAAADEVWRVAKARLIELETGAPPQWATDDRAHTHGDDAPDAVPGEEQSNPD
jgi:hypothetical protein